MPDETGRALPDQGVCTCGGGEGCMCAFAAAFNESERLKRGELDRLRAENEALKARSGQFLAMLTDAPHGWTCALESSVPGPCSCWKSTLALDETGATP